MLSVVARKTASTLVTRRAAGATSVAVRNFGLADSIGKKVCVGGKIEGRSATMPCAVDSFVSVFPPLGVAAASHSHAIRDSTAHSIVLSRPSLAAATASRAIIIIVLL